MYIYEPDLNYFKSIFTMFDYDNMDLDFIESLIWI